MASDKQNEFNHIQHHAPEYTEEVLWHRIYAVGILLIIVVCLFAWGAYHTLRSTAPANNDVLNVDLLAPPAAIPTPLSDIELHEEAIEDATPIDEPLPVAATDENLIETNAVSAEPTHVEPQQELAVIIQVDHADVDRAVLTQQMKALEPVSELQSTETLTDSFIKLYFFTDINGRAGDRLTYTWKRNGKIAARVQIPVGSDRWRSHSSKNINHKMRGNWEVFVTDKKNQLLASATFTLQP